MKVKIIKASKDTFWYAGYLEDEDKVIGTIREVEWVKSHTSFIKHPRRWFSLLFKIEDSEMKKKNGGGWMYNWADVKIVSWF